MNLKSTLLIAGAMLTAASAAAVPARRDVRTVTQPDGSTLRVRLVGDEHFHQLLTEDGMLLIENPQTGVYEYATLNSAGRLQSLGVQAADASLRTPDRQQIAVKFNSEMGRRARAAAPRRTIAQNGMGRFTCSFPRKGEARVLVILAEYKDEKCTVANPHEYFTRMLNERGFSDYGMSGSCADYFSDNSRDQFIPQFDLYGPVTLPQNRSYYGGNDYYGQDRNPEQMIVDACRLLDSEIYFADYDNDGDGKVDNIYLFYAGQGEASYGPANSVWPHAWELTSAGIDLKLDGVIIDRYAMSNEWERDRPDGIGTFIHEFSHVMGLPDLYTTDYGDVSPFTPGDWSVMDYGPYNNDGCTPPAYSIYERNAMTWLEPEVIDSPCSPELADIKESNAGYIIPTTNENEFFLIENRQQTGWDAYVPGHGMLIWHIDFDQYKFDDNSVNDQEHQYVDIVEACGYADNESASAMAGYPWPGTSGKTEFTPSTTPALKDWSGNAIDLPLTDITETNGIITFDVAGGAQPIPTPVAQTPSELGDDYFVATWMHAEGATDYEVNLYAESADGEAETVTADMGSGKTLSLPEGWTSSSDSYYATTGNYGEASPSYKFGNDGAWLETEEWAGDIKSVSFWCKGQQAEGSSLEILGRRGNSWNVIETITPGKTEIIRSEINDIPAGIHALRFVWHKAKGNLSLDDVVITIGASYELHTSIPSTGGENMVRFEGLATGKYYYTVAATDGEYKTPHSAPMYVELTTSGISAIEGDDSPARPLYFDMLGRRILNPAPGTICIERRGIRTIKRIIR